MKSGGQNELSVHVVWVSELIIELLQVEVVQANDHLHPECLPVEVLLGMSNWEETWGRLRAHCRDIVWLGKDVERAFWANFS